CEVPDNPNGCVPRGTQGCCDQPGFIVPTFFVNILGGLCSRVDQIACGAGVVNSSNPQTGDNAVNKSGDTSDPGADCCYNGHPAPECLNNTNLNDDPSLTAQGGCNPNGAGKDYKGKIVRTIGNGSHDADGIHFRLVTPELSTTWTDGQSPPGTCAPGSTYDDGELLVSQLILKAEPTTAGASGSFTDQNGDGCKRAGAGFIAASNLQTDGPIAVPGAQAGGPARPQSYDGTQGSVAAAAPAIRSPRNASWRTPACLLVATFVAVGGASPSRATSLPGGGPAATDCYVVLNAQGTALAARPNRLECKDGDPQCDQDGDCHNGSCKFRVRVCIDQDGCQAPSALRSLQIGPAKLAIPRPTTLSGAACGDFADVPVSLKGKGKTRPGKQVIVLKARAQGAKSTDIDKDTLVCLPRPASEPCPTTTTS